MCLCFDDMSTDFVDAIEPLLALLDPRLFRLVDSSGGVVGRCVMAAEERGLVNRSLVDILLLLGSMGAFTTHGLRTLEMAS